MLRRAMALVLACLLALGLGAATAEAATPRISTPKVTAKTIATAKASTIFGGGLFVQPDGEAALAAKRLKGSQKSAAAYIARRSSAIWLGDWARGGALKSFLQRELAAAEKQGRTPVFVTYALPDRDCGGASAGGLTAASYASWTTTVATTIKGHRAVLLVEPDSLSTGCTSYHEKRWTSLIAAAVKRYHAAGIPAYLDGGLSGTYLDPTTMSARLKAAGIRYARGFFTNVSNYRATTDEKAWAATLSASLGGVHYVIDTSRNGTGYHDQWCNDLKAGLGTTPRVVGSKALDALLWIKTPGESDGACNGGPNAGTWYPKLAVALVAHRAK